MIGEWVYVNGAICAKDAATVSVFDHGFLYGDGVFEGIAVARRAVFKLDAHIERLRDSARYLAIAAPEVDALREAALQVARRNNLDEGYLRIVLTRGAGPVGIRNMDKLGAPTLVMIAQHEVRAQRAAIYEHGLTAVIAATRRIPPECVDGKAKTCNYINNILGFQEAIRAGADEAIMLNDSGYITEATADNIFVIRGGEVLTPPAYLGLLKGITRGVVLELAREMAIPSDERVLVMQDVYTADEVFLTGTGAELVPVVEVDGRRIGAGRPGPVFLRLLNGFRERTKWDGVPLKPESPAKVRSERALRAARASEASLQ